MLLRRLTVGTALALSTFLVVGCSESSPEATTGLMDAAPSFAHNKQGGAAIGTTLGWFDGETVEFFYNKDFFCRSAPVSDAPSGCTLGEEPTVNPRGGNIPVLYVVTPIGFTPSQQLQCPDEACINHPTTLDVTPVQTVLESVLGPLPANGVIPTPAHSHIVESRQGGWWEIEVNGVFDQATWDEIEEAKSLDKIRELQAQQRVTADIPTNLFLFFNVRPLN